MNGKEQSTDGFTYFRQRIHLDLAGKVAEKMSVTLPGSLERVAFHEVGHYTIMRHQGIPVDRIVIGPEGGCCYPEGSKIEPLRETLNKLKSDEKSIAKSKKPLRVCGRPADMKLITKEIFEILRPDWSLICKIIRELMARAAETGRAEISGAELEGLWNENKI